jgi:hypothetical protein
LFGLHIIRERARTWSRVAAIPGYGERRGAPVVGSGLKHIHGRRGDVLDIVQAHSLDDRRRARGAIAPKNGHTLKSRFHATYSTSHILNFV